MSRDVSSTFNLSVYILLRDRRDRYAEIKGGRDTVSVAIRIVFDRRDSDNPLTAHIGTVLS